jgi:hypothetical protein
MAISVSATILKRRIADLSGKVETFLKNHRGLR